MTRDELETAIRARPFQPFRLRMADGYRYEIGLPDQLLMRSPRESNRMVVIGMKNEFHHVDIGFAVAIEFPQPVETSEGAP